MAKTATLSIRVDEDVKKQTEKILDYWGLNISTAVNMFFKQVIHNDGLPFRADRHAYGALDVSGMSKKQILAEIEKGVESGRKHGYIDANKAIADLRKEYGL